MGKIMCEEEYLIFHFYKVNNDKKCIVYACAYVHKIMKGYIKWGME